MDTKVYVRPGDFFAVTLPWSEVCMHMHVADRRMLAELTTGTYPAVQLWKDDRRFSGPITTGEAGLYRDQDGFYGYDVEVRESGAYNCPCCSDVVYGTFTRTGPNGICGACREAGCEIRPDANGDLTSGYWACQRTDTDGE